MWMNIIFGLIIPWIPGIYLIKKDLKIFLLIAPFASVVAFTFDVLGFHMEFWRISPEREIETVAALPMYLGVYPILAAYLFFFIKRSHLNRWILIFAVTLITTIIEFIGVSIDMVHYFNGWNIFWTFVSYLLAYLVSYGYFLILKKHVDV
ncbi:CBO0543 family protein [Bacillus sp. Marseille-Q3570]|uniref:CBO0543 family protein n=1 Tax=Bacillus sp. Marseille-Q3570 TaxID=2963522 RepID=UPI0021B7812A|nr:CBO0543 family protein [Bacillus sp. Marseille-Q3570]